MKKLNFLMLGLILLSACKSESKHWELKSPDNKITISINSSVDTKELSYQVSLIQGNTASIPVSGSPLGIVREDGDFSKDLEFINFRESKNVKVDYTLKSGKQRDCKNEYNEIVLEFQNGQKQPVNIIFRAFNNGLAFSYEFPSAENKEVKILSETSGFNIPTASAWMHSYDKVTKYAPGYETFYEGPIASGTPAAEGQNGWAYPALFETEAHQWVLISESGMDGKYFASHLDVSGNQGLYLVKNPVASEAMGLYENTASVSLPYKTPWRVIMTGNHLSDIVSSNLITDLADEAKITDTDWVKPGRASWSWWSDNASPQDYNRMLPFIDLASEMGWEYFLVDANWNIMKNGDVARMAEYAAKKNVKLLLWYNSGGPHNEVTEQPRDLMFEKEARRNEFKRIHELGVAGVKVDFFQSDKPEIINQYIDILKDAAEFQILVNFHGCTLPRGWSRTYPNLVSSEAVRGAESYIFDPLYPENAPRHLTIIPFTRGVVGPTDYTPGCFSEIRYPHLTSNAFELALPVILETGIIHYADSPKSYHSLPDFAVSFLKNLPVLWDEVKLLDGYPAKYTVLARRSGNRWFIGGINGQKEEQTAKIDLSGITKNSLIQIITDGQDNRSFEVEDISGNSGVFEIKMAALGGFVCVVEGDEI